MAETYKAKGIRKIVAERMLQSWHTSPVVLYAASCDMSKVSSYRNTLKERYGRKISMNVLFAKAAATALKEHPCVNGSFIDNEITLHDEIHIGFAVGLKEGVMVPVTRNTDLKDFAEVAADLDRLFDGARKGTLGLDDIQGSTFTITNVGRNKDIEFHMPIINQPEVAILGVYAPVDTPVVRDGEIVIRPMMKLSLVADHRLVDGLPAGEFLSRLKELLENPEMLDA